MRLILRAAVLGLVACGGAVNPEACPPLIQGIPVVTGPPGSSTPVSAGVLEELWTLGGISEGPDFVVPAAFAASDSGALAVVDHSLGEVVVIDEGGDWTAWGMRGSGPGELMMPVAASWSGSELAVFDIGHSRVMYFSEGVPSRPDLPVDPRFIAPVVNAGDVSMVAVRSNGSVILRYPPVPSSDGDGTTADVNLLMFEPESGRVDTLAAAAVRMFDGSASSRFFAPGTGFATVGVGSNGWWAVSAGDDTYRIIVRDSAGGARLQLCRPVPPLALSDGERGRHLTENRELAAELADLPAARTLGAVGRMLVGPRGEVWVERSRPAPFSDEMLRGVAGAALDVFSGEGRHLGQLTAPEGVRIQAFAGDRAWGLRLGEYGEAQIVGYRIRWSEQPSGR